MKRMISLALALMLMGGIVGCTNKNNSSGSSSDDTIIIPTPEEEVIEYTNYKLVDNGTTAYKIVIEDNASKDEKLAAQEITQLFAESTSISLMTVKASEVAYNADAKLIILGDTQYTQNAGVNVATIPQEGFTLKTVGSNLFILGKDKGVVYGSYEFLEKAVGYEYYLKDVYALDKNVTNLNMPKLNFSDSPDILYRADAWMAETSTLGETRARIRQFQDAFMFHGISYHIHNTFFWLPKSLYQREHPGWYSDDGGQLCYTAHGDAQELADMQETMLEEFKAQVEYYFSRGDYRQAISFTQQDDDSWCTCEACSKVLSTKGANSAGIIQFLNPIAREFKTWLNTTYPGHEVSIVFFAYQNSENAPVVEVNGSYAPIDDSVVMEDNLAVWIAPIGADFTRKISDFKNTAMYTTFQKWSALTENFYVWGYDTNFSNYLMGYDTFNALPEFYRYVRSFGTQYMFNQGQAYSEQSTLTRFDALKVALNYQLMWDADLDVKRFTDRFFATWFGVASTEMREYYESYRRWLEYIKTELNSSGGVYRDSFTAQEYPKQVLMGWQENIENAYKAIESLQDSNPTEYQKIYNRISAEKIAIQYGLIAIHGHTYTLDTLLVMKQTFKDEAIELGFKQVREGTSINTLWDSWGL